MEEPDKIYLIKYHRIDKDGKPETQKFFEDTKTNDLAKAIAYVKAESKKRYKNGSRLEFKIEEYALVREGFFDSEGNEIAKPEFAERVAQ